MCSGVEGVSFVVWVPAKSIHIIGDFNNWNNATLLCDQWGGRDVELFVPGAKVGDKYKYGVLGADGVLREKSDPFGWRFEALGAMPQLFQAEKLI